MRRWSAVAAALCALALSSSAMAQSASNGNALYHTYCVGCHGDPPGGGPERATSGAFIANQIRTSPSMQFLQSDPNFDSAHITASTDDIYAWLQSRSNPPPPPPPPPSSVPAINSALSVNGTVGQGFAYQIGATNSPTSYGATGLPAGLSINPASGLISGTPGAAGTFNVTVSATNAGGTGAQVISVTIAAAPPVTANIPGSLSGLFYNANESGWGVHFTQRGSNVFAAWYTYDTSGNPKWYVATCAMAGGATGTTGTCSGQLFEVTGPRFFGVAFDTRLVNAVAAGTLQVTFQNANSASMTYTGVAGQTRTVAIVRQPLATGAAPDVNYTDIWWGGTSESGWGMAITQQVSTVFLAWYVYDANAKPTWFVALCTMSGSVCTGDLLRTTGPAFGPTFNSSQVQVFTAGTVSVTFTDANNATLNYTVNGVPASKTITRQVF